MQSTAPTNRRRRRFLLAGAIVLAVGAVVAEIDRQPEPSPPTEHNPPAHLNPGFAAPSRGSDLSDATERAFDAFCGLNLRYIEAMFDATRTTCRITGYLHSLMILFIAEQPVFSVPATRKAWVAAVVLTAGKTIRDLGGYLIGVDYVGLTDRELTKSGRVARLRASFAEQLQAAVHDGKVDAIVAVGDLDRRLARTLGLTK
jgi:hypothetical protein